MHPHLLLIALLLSQALMSAGPPVVRAAPCEPLVMGCSDGAPERCCGLRSCAGDRGPREDRPSPDGPAPACCCLCVFLDSTPALPPTFPEKRTIPSPASILAGEPSFPILTGDRAGALGLATRPPPPESRQRRAMLCCWTI